MKPTALPAFADHCLWMLHDDHQAIVVDPGDAAPVQAALDAQGLALAGILVTLRHPARIGGVALATARPARPARARFCRSTAAIR